MHRFEYRIGFQRLHSLEQWDTASKIEGVKTTYDVETQLKKLPNEQCRLQYNVYACLICSDGNVVKISKHPIGILTHTSIQGLHHDLINYVSAHTRPIFDREAFGSWDYLVINSDELTQEIIDYQLKELDKEKRTEDEENGNGLL